MGGGSGTISNPFLICTQAHLVSVQEDLSAHYKLMANLDLSSVDFSPIGYGLSFTGTFDGNGHTISNWNYEDLEQLHPVGLFSALDGGATIKNLTLSDFSVLSSGTSGLLVGAVNSGSILNCSVQGDISMTGVAGGAQGFVGGLVGLMSSGMISSSSFSGSIAAESELPQAIGGLVGKGLNHPILSDSYFRGSINAGASLNTEGVGGIVGVTNDGATLRRLYVGGTITGPNVPKGGLVGASDATTPTIVNSYFSTEKTGIGVYPGTLLSAKTNIQLRSQATFDGWDFSRIWTISTGQFPLLRASPSPTPTCDPAAEPFGGGVGTSESPFLICALGHLYEVSNDLAATYQLESDLSLSGDAVMVPIGIATGLPFTGKFEGNGYSISNWSPSLGSGYSVGLFYGLGQGAIVQNLSLKNFFLNSVSSSFVGALAGTAQQAMIQNVSASGLNIQGQNDVGGLIGKISDTTITQVRIDGEVSASSRVGGLVGAADLDSDISGVRSEAFVSGNQLVGGLVGLLDGSKIQKSFAFGTVTGFDGASEAIGGLVGETSGIMGYAISNSAVGGAGIISSGKWIGGLVGKNISSGLTPNHCYVAAPIVADSGINKAGLVVDAGGSSTLVNSFFDSDLTGLSGGQTTSQMQDQETFAGWDFDQTWQMPTGSYPTLRW